MFTKLFLVTLLSLIPSVYSPNNFDFQKSGDQIEQAKTLEFESDLPKKKTDSLGVKLDSKEAVVLDYKTKKILFEKDAQEKLPPASLTKIMTALVLFDSKKKLDDPARVSKKDTETVESTIGLEDGEIVTFKDLLAGSVIASGNDAALALAENVYKGDFKKFIIQMNEKTQKLGLKSTHFENPTGLDQENHYSSAYDLALLFSEALKNSTFKELISKKEYEFQALASDKKHKFESTNRLLKNDYPKIVGGKTGYTESAGFCLADLAKDKNGNQIITVVLGAKENGQQFQDTKALIEWTYNNYEWVDRDH